MVTTTTQAESLDRDRQNIQQEQEGKTRELDTFFLGIAGVSQQLTLTPKRPLIWSSTLPFPPLSICSLTSAILHDDSCVFKGGRIRYYLSASVVLYRIRDTFLSFSLKKDVKHTDDGTVVSTDYHVDNQRCLWILTGR
ncbi:hypothetical protein JOB18_048241 [Solea senegalensis]|uniref:Uncharacterized protein n=1 Tax=Solea senegalensis TaxID=28829 RepID=A0AAV6QLS9_SOLSE|nr:hypothetical protein JOB18_048241 [Solea senegalensis]